MPVSPRDIYELSRSLNTADCDEVTRRCVVSRAYYAALLGTDAIFEAEGGRRDGESSHAEIIGRAQAYGARDLPGRMYANDIAKVLPKLRRTRNKADYRIAEEMTPQTVNDVVERSAFVLARCEDVIRMREAAAKKPQ